LALAVSILATGNAWAASGTKMIVEYLQEGKQAPGALQAVRIVSHDSLAPSKMIVKFLRQTPEPTLTSTSLREGETMGKTGASYDSGTKRIVSFLRKG
jgi:hypothetical protein